MGTGLEIFDSPKVSNDSLFLRIMCPINMQKRNELNITLSVLSR